MIRSVLAVAFCLLAPSVLPAQAWRTFEAPSTHPVAVSADGSRLVAVNIPSATLDVFDVSNPARPVLLREIRVGVTPSSVRLRNRSEAWVTDFIGDCVHVVDIDDGTVRATLPTGDEPGDVAFAAGRAFVTATTDRQIVVFDAASRTRLGAIPVFADEPRAMVADTLTGRIYVASLLSGNDTTIVPASLAPPQPAPTNPALPPAPAAGLIVDSEDPAWTAAHGADLPDYDVFEIDATSLSVTGRVSGVGTVLFDVALQPRTGELWVANTEARNLIRFEPELRGHAVDNRISRIGGGGSVTPVDLNPGIDYTLLPNVAARSTALAQPTGIVFSATGNRAYVAAFGTDRVGVLDATGTRVATIEIGGGAPTDVRSRQMRGPRGLALHPAGQFLYVQNMLSNSLSVVDTSSAAEILEIRQFDRTPVAMREGRGFLYDARLSGNGTLSCASCHIDGRMDGVAWDLGDPGGVLTTSPGPLGPIPQHPMKGPMTTQTLQGLRGTNPLHWRGDRNTFNDFNGAFDSLMGGSQLSPVDMQSYTNAVLAIDYPSNPRLALDNSLTTQAAIDGRNLYVNQTFRTGVRCVDCHSLVTGTNRQLFPGAVLGEPQGFKVAQLRNMYKKTGRDPDPVTGRSTSGFGYLHDGSDLSLFEFLTNPVFGPLSTNALNKQRISEFVLSFPTETAAAVGHVVHVDASNAGDPRVVGELSTLEAQARRGVCELIAVGRIDGVEVGYLFDRFAGVFRPDSNGAAALTAAGLRAAAGRAANFVAFHGVARSAGIPLSIDEDGDGILNGDEEPEAYGAGHDVCGLSLRANRAPRIGDQEFALMTEGAPAGAGGLLLVGFLPVTVPYADFTIHVLTAPSVQFLVLADARGVATIRAPLPNDPGLVGASLYCQSFLAVPCGAIGIGATNGLRVTIGDR